MGAVRRSKRRRGWRRGEAVLLKRSAGGEGVDLMTGGWDERSLQLWLRSCSSQSVVLVCWLVGRWAFYFWCLFKIPCSIDCFLKKDPEL